MSVVVEITGLDKLQAKMEKYPAISEKYINMAIARALNRIFGEEKRQAPVFTGNMRDNWKIDIGRFEGKFSSNVPYSMAVHEGTRPHMPPVSALEAWSKKKGLNPWAVAKNIAKFGTKANPFLKRAVEAQKDQINGEFKTALENITNEISTK